MSAPSPAPPRVTLPEGDLLIIARALVGEAAPASVAPLLRARRPLPGRIGPTAMGLLKSTLAAGAVLELCRRGGARLRLHGRLWDRHPAPALAFGPVTVALLGWMVREPLGHDTAPAPAPGAAPGWGDELVRYLAADLLERAGLGAAIASEPLLAGPLVWLGFSLRLAGSSPPPAFGPLVDGVGAILVEGLEGDLARRAAAGVDPATARRFAEAARSAGRDDLVGLLDVSPVCSGGSPA